MSEEPRAETCPCALFARATEWAALAAARWLGRDDQDAAEEAAEGAMLAGLSELPVSATIVIGSEHHNPEMQRFSLVFSAYSDGHSTGAVGVIGPTRMRYSRAISAVESLSAAISRMVAPRS